MIMREITLCFRVFFQREFLRIRRQHLSSYGAQPVPKVSLHPFDRDNLMLDYMPYYGN